VVREHGHDLSASVVEDGHYVDARGFLVEGEEVANPKVMGNGKGCPPLIDDLPITLELGSHPLLSPSVCEDGDLPIDGSEPFDELRRDREHAQGPLEDDTKEVLRTNLVAEMVDVGWPSSWPLGRTLMGNLRRCA
jgi:hypothetical protein